MTPPAEYSNASQERGYRVLLTLAGHEVTGLSLSEIAKAVGASAATVLRDLRVLTKVGLAEQLTATGRWRLGPKLVQIAIAYHTNIDAARRRLDETVQRYTRIPT
jgi:DNA-binding IclR family transcriptional regulator